MKKSELPMTNEDDMLPEYDFSGGIRGKHFRTLQAGYTITIHQEDGSTIVKEVEPQKGAVILEPDVREYFPDSESVNRTLRSLIMLAPVRVKSKTTKTKRTPRRARS